MYKHTCDTREFLKMGELFKKKWERQSERVLYTLPDYYDTNLTTNFLLYIICRHMSIVADGPAKSQQPRFQSVLVLH